MGTQTKIADQSIEQEGEYALALKENQGNLYEEVKATFALAEKEACTGLQRDQIEALRRVTVGWKSGTTGPFVILRSWSISILRRGGKACEGLGWCEPNGAWIKRSPGKPATHLAQFPLGENVCLCSPKPTSALKTACIGCLMSLFVKMNHA